MRFALTSPSFLWQSCAEPTAAWFLVWMPLALLVLDPGASSSNAMARLLAVLMVSALIWARGLGPQGAFADRLFVAAWVGSWAAALGTLVTSGAWSTSRSGSAALFAALFVGAGWLGWAFHERQEHDVARRKQSPSEAPLSAAATPTAIFAAWLLAFSVLALLIRGETAHWSDGVVLFISLACFTAFQVTPAVEEDPGSPN